MDLLQIKKILWIYKLLLQFVTLASSRVYCHINLLSGVQSLRLCSATVKSHCVFYCLLFRDRLPIIHLILWVPISTVHRKGVHCEDYCRMTPIKKYERYFFIWNKLNGRVHQGLQKSGTLKIIDIVHLCPFDVLLFRRSYKAFSGTVWVISNLR